MKFLERCFCLPSEIEGFLLDFPDSFLPLPKSLGFSVVPLSSRNLSSRFSFYLPFPFFPSYRKELDTGTSRIRFFILV